MNFLEGGKSSVRNRRKILSRKGGQIKWEKLQLTVQPDNFMIMMQSFSVGFSLLSSLRCPNILKKLLRSLIWRGKFARKSSLLSQCVCERDSRRTPSWDLSSWAIFRFIEQFASQAHSKSFRKVISINFVIISIKLRRQPQDETVKANCYHLPRAINLAWRISWNEWNR